MPIPRDDSPHRSTTAFIRTVEHGHRSPPRQRSHITYRVQENYSGGHSPTRSSPPPPPYSPPRPPPAHRTIHVSHETSPHSRSEFTRTVSPAFYHGGGYRNVETVVVGPRSAAHNVSPTLQGRSPSPFQERGDPETTVRPYQASDRYQPSERYPEGAPSKIVYSSHVVSHSPGSPSGQPGSPITPQAQQEADPQALYRDPGRVESEYPARQTQPPTSLKIGNQMQNRAQYLRKEHSPSPSSPTGKSPGGPGATPSSPRPYQLKPTMDACSPDTTRQPAVFGSQPGRHVAKEAEVDALTDLLVQNMNASADPDFFGEQEV